jgi:hypothetical protein
LSCHYVPAVDYFSVAYLDIGDWDGEVKQIGEIITIPFIMPYFQKYWPEVALKTRGFHSTNNKKCLF